MTVKPALSGLVTLVKLSSFSSAEVDTVMEGCVLLSSPLFFAEMFAIRKVVSAHKDEGIGPGCQV